jgi:hypothetical protein
MAALGQSKDWIFSLYLRSKSLTRNEIAFLARTSAAYTSVKSFPPGSHYNGSNAEEFIMPQKLLYVLIVLCLIIIVLAPVHW